MGVASRQIVPRPTKRQIAGIIQQLQGRFRFVDEIISHVICRVVSCLHWILLDQTHLGEFVQPVVHSPVGTSRVAIGKLRRRRRSIDRNPRQQNHCRHGQRSSAIRSEYRRLPTLMIGSLVLQTEWFDDRPQIALPLCREALEDLSAFFGNRHLMSRGTFFVDLDQAG
jgi:hypothetical protein